MCLAVPGKIIAINGDMAIVDYGIEKRKGNIIEKGFKIGDFVIIQGGIVIEKIEKKEAEEALRLYNESLR